MIVAADCLALRCGWSLRELAEMSNARKEEDEKRCRLCLEGDDGPLVQPCACRGTAKFIHNACLEHWRRTGP